MSKHDVAKGSFKVQGVDAGAASGVTVKVRMRELEGALDSGRGVCRPALACRLSVYSSHATPAQITGPNGDAEFDKADAAEGRFAFTAADGGEHSVCFINKGACEGRGRGRANGCVG